ncbi:MAG: shikimate kinase [Rhodoluna sp.]|nr:shikimate kinase [Rhodoluna sp.]
MLSRPVVLIGPMGVGKTTIGKKLAKRLEVPFVDTDVLVTKAHGEIPEIFENQGEAIFRTYEEQALKDALLAKQVVATGGGAVLSGENQRALEAATVIYLSTNGLHMRARLSNGNRPLLKNGMTDWKEIYESRKPLYERLATFEIDTSAAGLGKIIDTICEKLETL